MSTPKKHPAKSENSTGTTRGLSSGRNWNSFPLKQKQYEWSMEADGPLVQGPLEMESLRDQVMLLTLEPGQFGLLVNNDSLKALYLDGVHNLDIGEHGNQIQPESLLFFLSTDKSVAFRWTSNSEHGFTTSDGTKIIGRCSVRIEKPARFYHRNLRTMTDWSPEAVESHLEPLVQQAFNKLLAEVCQAEFDHAGGLQSTLMNLGASQLDEFLEEHGLFCESIGAYTAAPPVEDWQDQTAGQSADLLHN